MMMLNSLGSWSIVLLLGLFSSVSYYIFNVIYYVQPTPFIDEVFHIPQARKYCNGTFNEWDPMITTLPGVYLLSVGVIKPVAYLLSANLCTTYVLRLTNLVANTINLFLFYFLLKKIYRAKINVNEGKVLLSSLNMAIFPPLYFLSFLYYTEPVSTMLILLAILLHIHDMFFISSVIGFVSVVARQTNIVWVALLGLDGVIYVLNEHAVREGNKSVVRGQYTPKYVKAILLMLYKSKNKLSILLDILKVVFGYALVILAFFAFVIINNGIVIGDKQHHVASIHLPQLFYFSWFYLLFTCSFNVAMVYPFSLFVKKNWKSTIFVAVLFGLIVHFNTIAHPYLLADNRHYTFYIWKRLYQNYEIIRYLLIPVYLFGFFCIYNNINHLNFVNQLGFFIATALCLVPQQLFDIRYFIFPYLLLRLQTKSMLWWQLGIESILYLSINIFTIYIFVSKTFYWSDSAQPQRIMW